MKSETGTALAARPNRRWLFIGWQIVMRELLSAGREGSAAMNRRSHVLLWLAVLVLLAGACGLDSSEMGAEGDAGGRAASPRSEVTAEARAALTAGAGSVGNCNGNPARCAA